MLSGKSGASCPLACVGVVSVVLLLLCCCCCGVWSVFVSLVVSGALSCCLLVGAFLRVSSL